jgi:deoxyribodipyrimidine photo-lyase
LAPVSDYSHYCRIRDESAMSTTLLWLRQDLRLTDNPALEAARHSERLVPVYIHDPALHGAWLPGAASNWWLHHSLEALDRELRQRGSALLLRRGPTAETLMQLAVSCNASRVCWNRRYQPSLIAADRDLKSRLRASGLAVHSDNAALLFEPWEVMRNPGTAAAAPYRVFTAYWRACLRLGLAGVRHAPPQRLPALPPGLPSLPLQELGLLPRVPWDGGLRQHWQPGEQGALACLERFLRAAIHAYPKAREQPAIAGTSALSPHLHFGEIGPRQIIQAAQQLAVPNTAGLETTEESFIREIGWREFAHHLLFHFPQTDRQALNPRFHTFPWRTHYDEDLAAWQQGKTGIPLVDAGMRQLWHCGWMHNRVRMIVASFLCKNLLIPWQEGAAWFWDTLVDADLASNSLGWQWVAGCGADAAPYFRLFNPVRQGEKFDPEGTYVRRWVAELRQLPARYIHQPWTAPASLQASIATYPAPLTDLKASRETALAAYRNLPAAPTKN